MTDTRPENETESAAAAQTPGVSPAPAERSLLGTGAVVYSEQPQPRTVTALWEAVRDSLDS